MTNVVIVKAIEQSTTISFAVIFILADFYVAGAVIGTAVGYMITGVAAFIIFRKYAWPLIRGTRRRSRRLNPVNPDENFTFRKN